MLRGRGRLAGDLQFLSLGFADYLALESLGIST